MNTVGTGAILLMDIGLYRDHTLWAPLKTLYIGSASFAPARNIDRSSYKGLKNFLYHEELMSLKP